MMNWIKTWSLIEDDKMYVLFAANRHKDDREWFRCVGTSIGWAVKLHLEGCYVAAEVELPKSLKECR